MVRMSGKSATDRPALGLVLADWFAGVRRDLPWREPEARADPYRVLVSETMLQQTRVATVVPYYRRFLATFPDVHALAAAAEADVMSLWKGLGYYSRARNLHRAAQAIVRDHGGHVPDDPAALLRLPGIGEYTAGAIRSIAFGQPAPAVDGNVLRVLARFDGIAADIAAPATRRRIAQAVMSLSPPGRTADFSEGLMELGATVCLPTSPDCPSCPWRDSCSAHAAGRTAELPVKRPKPAPEETHRIALVVRCGTRSGDGRDRILVEYRESGLLGGLWGFPEWESEWMADRPAGVENPPRGLDEDVVAAFEERSGIRLHSGRERYVGHVVHVFTHRRWRMDVFLGEADCQEPLPPFRWVTEDEFEVLPVSRAFQKVGKKAHSAP